MRKFKGTTEKLHSIIYKRNANVHREKYYVYGRRSVKERPVYTTLYRKLRSWITPLEKRGADRGVS